MSKLIRRASQVLLSSEDQVTDGSSQEDNGALKPAIGKEERSHNRLHENNIVGRKEEGEEGDESADAGSETQPLLPRPTAAEDRHMPLREDENSRTTDSESGTKGNEESDSDDSDHNREEDVKQQEAKMDFLEAPESWKSGGQKKEEEEEELQQLMRETRRERMFCGRGPSHQTDGVFQSSLRYVALIVFVFLVKAYLRRMSEEKGSTGR